MRNFESTTDKCFDSFKVGDIFYHLQTHAITEQDNLDFCLLTHNTHPLHRDAQYAAGTRFGRIVVPGTYVFSLVVGLSVPDISIRAIANLEYQDIIHHSPVFIGDTISARSCIIGKQPSRHHKPQGVITVESQGFNQNDELVLTYTRKVLLPTNENVLGAAG